MSNVSTYMIIVCQYTWLRYFSIISVREIFEAFLFEYKDRNDIEIKMVVVTVLFACVMNGIGILLSIL